LPATVAGCGAAKRQFFFSDRVNLVLATEAYYSPSMQLLRC